MSCVMGHYIKLSSSYDFISLCKFTKYSVQFLLSPIIFTLLFLSLNRQKKSLKIRDRRIKIDPRHLLHPLNLREVFIRGVCVRNVMQR